MSELHVRGRGLFSRTHKGKVIHLTETTVRTGFPPMKPPAYLKRPLKFLVLFFIATGMSVLLCVLLAVIITSMPRIGVLTLSVGGIVLLTFARRWADAYYDQRPHRPRPRLVR